LHETEAAKQKENKVSPTIEVNGNGSWCQDNWSREISTAESHILVVECLCRHMVCFVTNRYGAIPRVRID
jgi:hypothetical protein